MPLPPGLPEQALVSPMHLLYLHGFASSARSSKAAYFRERAAERGVELLTPDFNEPDFEGLTITRMVDQVSKLLARLTPGPVAIIGSSLGAFIAVQVALRQPRVDRLVLLAPALDFSGNRLRDLGDRGLEEWRRTDTLNVFHYGFGRMMPVRFGLPRMPRDMTRCRRARHPHSDLPGLARRRRQPRDREALGRRPAERRVAPPRRRPSIDRKPRYGLGGDCGISTPAEPWNLRTPSSGLRDRVLGLRTRRSQSEDVRRGELDRVSCVDDDVGPLHHGPVVEVLVIGHDHDAVVLAERLGGCGHALERVLS